MTRRQTQRFVYGWMLATLVVNVVALYLGTHLMLTETRSLAPGLYWRLGRPQPLARGMLVQFSAPDSVVATLARLRPGQTLIKAVTALPGETVCWRPEAMEVDGQAFVRQAHHLLHASLRGCRTLDASQVILTGTHPQSFDSRDIGPVDTRRILAQVVPLWTW